MMLQVLKNWAMLQRSQWMSKTELNNLQARELHKIVGHAFQKVPFYRRLYEMAKVTPSDIVNGNRIERLPIVTREHLNTTPLLERTAVDADVNSCVLNTTSGSTGTPATLLEDPAWAAYHEALKLRYMQAYGIKPWTKVCSVRLERDTLIPESLADKQGMWSIVRRKLVKQLLAPTSDICDHLDFFLSWKPDVIIAGPSYWRAFMKLCERLKRTPSFKMVISFGEMLDDSTRKLIRDWFGAEVYDIYATEEAGTIAWECPTHSGYHINADSSVVEFLKNGKGVVGEPGEVCVTVLHRLATPFIRYLVGDVATCFEDECPCGRSLPLLESIQGRTLDFVQIEDGRLLSPYEVVQTLQEARGVKQFKVIQNHDRTIQVLVNTTEKNSDNTLRDVRNRCRQLFNRLPVTVTQVNRIEDLAGTKTRFIESRLDAH
jgi:phenylacetate-CoA ligase